MKLGIMTLAFGLATLMTATTANARVHVDLVVNPFGFVTAPPPVIYQPQPYYEPPPVVYYGGGYWDHDHDHRRGHPQRHGDHDDHRHK